MRKYGLLAVFAVLIFVVGSLSACAGGTGSQPPDPPKNFVIAISPTSVSLVAGKTQQFQIVVSVNGVPTPANDYNLFVNDVPGGNATVGTIVTSGTQKGFYTAPATVPNPATVTVKAVIIADPSKSAIAIVTILDVSAVTSVTASCDPTTVLANQTSQCTATAQGTGGFNPAVTWSASVGTITSSGLFTAPASAGTATITATSVQTPTVSGTANITVNPPPPLTVSLSETATTVVLGGSHSFTATPSDPAATISWSLSGPGSLSVPSGTVSVYSVPTSVPTGFSATITLNYPATTITGASPRNIFLVREGFAGITFSGSGIYPGCTYRFDATGPANSLTPNANFTQFTVVLIFDSDHFDPRAGTVAVDCTPNGHGSGNSNAFGFSFLGNQN
ncbi:MAG: hypothetical protein Q8P49_02450, partial [Candidatus Liptonbacteria bacterium]|nr:hypothetical protein [Candidatus Liptonbacteria bacterium]